MTSVAIVGANGYVGTALCAAFAQQPNTVVTPVTRSTYAHCREQSFDVLINAAMPSKRFWARSHPEIDFVETVQKTAGLVHTWRFDKFVQVSTISARTQLDTVYGRHKAAAERLCEFVQNLIVRLGPMYGAGLTKGVLIDMLHHRTVFVDGDSRYCFAPLDFVAKWIAAHVTRSGVIELGARNSVRLRDVAKHLNAFVEFKGPVDHQELENPLPEFPDAADVFRFLDAMLRQNRPAFVSTPL